MRPNADALREAERAYNVAALLAVPALIAEVERLRSVEDAARDYEAVYLEGEAIREEYRHHLHVPQAIQDRWVEKADASMKRLAAALTG